MSKTKSAQDSKQGNTQRNITEQDIAVFIKEDINSVFKSRKGLENLAKRYGEHSETLNPEKNPLYFVDRVLYTLGNYEEGRDEIREIVKDVFGRDKISSRKIRQKYTGGEHQIPLRQMPETPYYEILKSESFKQAYSRLFLSKESPLKNLE